MTDETPRSALEDFARRARDLPALRRLDAAAVEAFDAFGLAGIDALLLKGPALGDALYKGSGEHRRYSDVDLLVSPHGLAAARGILEQLGYLSIPDHLGLEDVAGVLDAETWSKFNAGEENGTMVDLHRRMPGSEAPPQLAWDLLWGRRTSLALDGRQVPTLDTVGLAMHVAIHAAQHGPSYGQPIDDLRRGLGQWSLEVWRGASELAREIAATEPFVAGLRQLPEGDALVGELELSGVGRPRWAFADRQWRPRGTFHLQALAEAPTMRRRMSIVRHSLFPAPEWIAWQYPWARGRRVRLAVAYGLHLARAPLWAARALRFARRKR